MIGRLSEHQAAILRWILGGCLPGEEPSAAYKASALALQNRRLVEITKRGGVWHAVVTEAGRHYIEHGEYPTGQFLAKRPQEPKPPAADSSDAPMDRRAGRSRVSKREPSPSPEVDSPARVRAEGIQCDEYPFDPGDDR